jgi:hypothetical protein
VLRAAFNHDNCQQVTHSRSHCEIVSLADLVCMKLVSCRTAVRAGAEALFAPNLTIAIIPAGSCRMPQPVVRQRRSMATCRRAPIDRSAATRTGTAPRPSQARSHHLALPFRCECATALGGECQPTLCDATAMGETGWDRWLCMTIPASQPVSPMIMR